MPREARRGADRALHSHIFIQPHQNIQISLDQPRFPFALNRLFSPRFNPTFSAPSTPASGHHQLFHNTILLSTNILARRSLAYSAKFVVYFHPIFHVLTVPLSPTFQPSIALELNSYFSLNFSAMSY